MKNVFYSVEEETINYYSISLEKANFSVRSMNALTRAGIQTVGELLELDESYIYQIRNLGPKSVDEIMSYIKKIKKDTSNESESIYSWIDNNKDLAVQYFEANDIPVSELDLSTRTYNFLKLSNITKLSQFIFLNQKELQPITDYDNSVIKEIQTIARMHIHSHRSSLRNLKENGRNTENEENVISQSSVFELLNNYKYRPKVIEYLQKKDTLIEKSNLSVRSRNGLLKAGIKTLSLLAQEYNNLDKIRNLGKKSYKEINDFLNDELCKRQEKINSYCLDNQIDIFDESDSFEIEEIILDSYKYAPFKGLSYRNIRSICPEYVSDEKLKQQVGLLLKEKKLEYVDFRCYRTYPSFFDVIHSLFDNEERNFEILRLRLEGNTLEQIGSAVGITRERARQIITKMLNKARHQYDLKYGLSYFDEDYYSYLYQNYILEKEIWFDWIGVSKATYFYLTLVYSHGKGIVEDAVKDENIDVNIRIKLRNYLNRDKVLIDGVLIERKRAAIEDYAIEKFCKKTIVYSEFIEIYNKLLNDNGVFDDDLLISEEVERTRYNRYSLLNNCLWIEGKKLRYYNVEKYDFTELLETINLPSYVNTEVNTLKLIRDHPALMEKYDIHNQYELHNLLKKIVDVNTCHDIDFNRQPIIRFGEFSRSQMVYEYIQLLSPVSTNDLVKIISNEYGYEDFFIRMTMLPEFSIYNHNGMYSVNQKSMDEHRMNEFKKNLTEDFYYIDEIKEKYRSTFTDANLEEINPYNLKRMGFSVFSKYVLQNYPSLEYYFTTLLTASDVYDISDMRNRYSYINVFNEVYRSLLRQYDYFEYEPRQMISINKLNELGITKDDVNQYCDAVMNFVDDESFFNVNILKENGFSDALDELGFDNYFYGSILRHSGLFKWVKAFDEYIFYKGDNISDLNRGSFIITLLSEYESVDIDEFIADVYDRFGIAKLTKEFIVQAIKGTELYYDSIMNKVYLNESYYYAEFDD